jgi:hypothetical protein
MTGTSTCNPAAAHQPRSAVLRPCARPRRPWPCAAAVFRARSHYRARAESRSDPPPPALPRPPASPSPDSPASPPPPSSLAVSHHLRALCYRIPSTSDVRIRSGGDDNLIWRWSKMRLNSQFPSLPPCLCRRDPPPHTLPQSPTLLPLSLFPSPSAPPHASPAPPDPLSHTP